ncbi:MAG: hypothetical protein RSB20_04435 [Clostridia bacterium]
MGNRLQQLYNVAIDNNISIAYGKLHNKQAFCCEFEEKHIVIDYNCTNSEQTETLLIAEEIGHCISDSMYYLRSTYSPIQQLNVNKAEYVAKCWAMRAIVPICQLKSALKTTTDTYVLADMFDVNNDYMLDVIKMYKSKNEL